MKLDLHAGDDAEAATGPSEGSERAPLGRRRHLEDALRIAALAAIAIGAMIPDWG
jgi:hypothetical protein